MIDHTRDVGSDAAMRSAALESLGVASFMMDQDARIVYANAAFEAVTGYTMDEVSGKGMSVFTSGSQPEAFYEDMWNAIREYGKWEGTLWNQRKLGEPYHARLDIRRFHDASGRVCHIGTFSDISEQDERQRALVDAQKHALLALLCSTMAHNINNYLGVIQGSAQLGQTLTEDENSTRYFSRIQSASQSISEFTERMMRVSCHDQPDGQPFELDALLRQAMPILQSMLPAHIRLMSDVPEQPRGVVVGNPSELEQTLIDLVVNARDALEGQHGAWIRIDMSTSAEPACPEACPTTAVCPVRMQRRATVRVRDNASGIPEAVRDKVFDPFFTTKEPGEGTGLGLAACKHIVERMSGKIWCDGGQPAGSVFNICLPLCDETPSAPDRAG